MPRGKRGHGYEVDSAMKIVKRVCAELNELENNYDSCKNELIDFVDKAKKKSETISELDKSRQILYRDLNNSLDMTVVAIASLKQRCPLPEEPHEAVEDN